MAESNVLKTADGGLTPLGTKYLLAKIVVDLLSIDKESKRLREDVDLIFRAIQAVESMPRVMLPFEQVKDEIGEAISLLESKGYSVGRRYR